MAENKKDSILPGSSASSIKMDLMHFKDDILKDIRIKNKIYDYPEILVIIINNNKNIVKINIKIKLNKRNEYQLINFISGTNNENNHFNIIYKEQNDWRVYQNNSMNKNNIVNDLNSHIPIAIFYEKIKSMTDKKSDASYVTDIFDYSSV